MKVEICIPFGVLYQFATGEVWYAMKPTLDAVLAEHGLTQADIVPNSIKGEIVHHDDYPDDTTAELVWSLELSELGQ